MSNIDSLIVQANNLLLLIKKSINKPVVIDGKVDSYTADQINTLISTVVGIRNTHIVSLAARGISQKNIASMFELTPSRISQILTEYNGGKNGK